MSSVHDLARGHMRLLPLIEYALNEGWEVLRRPGGHLTFVIKPGLPPIYTSALAAARNAHAMLHRTLSGDEHG